METFRSIVMSCICPAATIASHDNTYCLEEACLSTSASEIISEHNVFGTGCNPSPFLSKKDKENKRIAEP
jgi:hypothetical protein